MKRKRTKRYLAPRSASARPEDLMYAYHVTLKAFLPAIESMGLMPHFHEHLPDEEDEAIFVERDEEGADIYSGPETVMLRFFVDGFGSTNEGEDVLYDVRVPPEDIEVRTDEGWQPLIPSRRTK